MRTKDEIEKMIVYLTQEMHRAAEFNCNDLAFGYYSKIQILEWILEGSNENN